MGKALVIVESPAKARTIGGLLGPGLHRGVLHRPHPRPPPGGRRGAGGLQGRGLGPARGGRRQRVQAALRGLGLEEVGGGQPQAAAQGRRRAVSRHRRRPRGRVHRLASLRGALAHRPGQAHGLPRDHPGGHRPGRRGVAGPRPPPGRRPGGAADPGPPVRLRGVAGAVAQGHAPALGRAGAERGHPHGGRAGAGPHALPLRHLVGHRRDVRPAPPPMPRRRPDSAPPWSRSGGTAVATGKDFNDDGVQTSKGTVRVLVEEEATSVATALAGQPFTVSAVTERPFRRSPAAPVHDLDPAAGGRAQAALQRPAGHAGGPAPLRAGLHHLHADRLDHPVRPGAHRGPLPGPRDVRRRLRARHAAPLRAQGQERPGGPRGDPPGRRDLPHARAGRARACRGTSSACTS